MIFTFLSFFLISAQAQETDLQKLFQREYSFLVSQKEMIKKESANLKAKNKSTKAQLELETLSLEKELARASTSNDLLNEQVRNQDRLVKEAESSNKSLKSSYKKLLKITKETEDRLQFLALDKNADLQLPANPQTSDFVELQRRSQLVLSRSVSPQNQQIVVRNLKGDLVQSNIQSFSSWAAQRLDASTPGPLAPDGSGILAQIQSGPTEARLGGFFIFENLTDKIALQHPAGFFDRLADALPILVLLMMFLLVGGLFVMFARD